MPGNIPRMRRSTLVFAAIASLFVMANSVNALRKGGDFTVFMDAGERLLDGAPLYAASGVAVGVVGPPFQGVFFAPFALLGRVDHRLSRLAWYALNLVALAAAVRAWSAALGPFAGRVIRWDGWQPEPAGPILVALVAILFPLQTNFEHQNMNVVLLALIGAAAWALERERDAAAGIAIGIAAALKAFPGLLLVYLLLRGRWTAFAAGTVMAGVLTLLPAFRYGADGMSTQMRDWLAISASGGWPIRGNNQSLFAMLARWLGPDDPQLHLAWMAVAACLIAATLLAASRWCLPDKRADAAGLVGVLTAAVLVSPIAWDHYWVLMFPTFLLLALAQRLAAWVRVLFWTALILTSGFSPATVGTHGLAIARGVSVFTWAGILLIASALALQLQLSRSVPAPRPGSDRLARR